MPTTPADRAGARVDYFPARAAFPKWQEGRHPHCHFRGLLRLYSRYGPSDRSATQGDPRFREGRLFVTRLRSHQLPSETARQLPDLSTIIRVEPSSTDDSRLQGALPIPDLMLEVQLVDRGTANSVRGTGAGAFRDQRPGSGIACSQDRRPPSCSTASRITAKSIASRSELTSGAD